MAHRKDPCDDELLRHILAGEGDVPVAAEHLGSCPRCQARIAELAGGDGDWREVREFLASDEEDKLLDAEARERPWSSTTLGVKQTAWTEAMAKQLLGPPSHPEMLGRLGRYEVERLIGSGGMGIVFKGFDTELNRPVAIKVLAPHLAGSGAARQRFSREARAAAAVVHEHVVAIHNVESDGAAPFLVMQYVAGESLQTRIDRQGPLTLREILRIAHQTAAGLAAAHAQGLVHRDVKPSNILLEEGIERALLTDFGLARAADDASLTHTGYLPGTPHYMSPEQARGEAIDATSDLFSLGSVIYAMCTARPPFRADTSFGVLRRITDTEPRAIREINPDIPAWLAVLVGKLLAKRAGERFVTAAEAATTIEQCLAHVQQPGAVALPVVCLVRPMRSRVGAWLVGAAVCLLLVGLAASYFGLFGGPSGEVNRRGSLRDTQPLLGSDDSSSSQRWNATAEDIQSLSSDAEALEQKTSQLWDRQPLSLPNESNQEPTP